MFRCPDCGQGKEIGFKGKEGENILLTLKNTMDGIESVVSEGEVFTEEESFEAFKQQLDKADQEQSIECEKCHVDRYTLNEWKEAKTDTLKYLEMEDNQLCHCGGELWMDQIPGTTSYGFVCEKCEWVKPKQRVSGA
jgi:hypothetical protein